MFYFLFCEKIENVESQMLDFRIIQDVECASTCSVFSFLQAILTRKNSLSRVKYSEEPAIFAWELMNEPRCSSNSSAPVLQV